MWVAMRGACLGGGLALVFGERAHFAFLLAEGAVVSLVLVLHEGV